MSRSIVFPRKVHSHYCEGLRLRLRQIATLHLWDVALMSQCLSGSGCSKDQENYD